jgi:hypothetical protein
MILPYDANPCRMEFSERTASTSRNVICNSSAQKEQCRKIPLDFNAEESVHACCSVMGNSLRHRLAWPLRRALGGGSAGIGPAHHDGGSNV